jgi:hypothetical protein
LVSSLVEEDRMTRLRTILTLALVAAILPTSLQAWPWHSKPSHPALEGAWRLVGTLSGPDGRLVPNSPGFEEYKLVNDGCFMWTSLQDGRIVRHAGGVARMGAGDYTERLDYANTDALSGFIGRTHEFRWKLVDGRWYHTGVLHGEGGSELHIAEVWERAR